MRMFIVKTVNLGLLCVVLWGYQTYAAGRSRQIEEYEKKEEAARQMWSEVEAQKEGGQAPSLADGIYKGSGTGFGGEIQVQIEIRDGKMISAEVLSAEKETPDYLKSAKKILVDVVDSQSADVDTVSGATLSSNGILEAVRNAMEAGNGKES